MRIACGGSPSKETFDNYSLAIMLIFNYNEYGVNSAVFCGEIQI